MPIVVAAACVHAPPEPAPEAAVAASVPPARAYAWYLQARVAEGLGDEAMAARGMGWAERLDRDDPHLYRQLLAHAQRRDDPKAALKLALDVLDAHPERPACELAFARRAAVDAWLALGHPGDARGHLDALAACPYPRGEVAWAHRTGDAEAAREALVRWHPTAASERLHAARWAVDLEREDLALDWLAPLVGHPGWPEAAPILREVAIRYPGAVRTLLDAVAFDAGPPWTELHASLDAP